MKLIKIITEHDEFSKQNEAAIPDNLGDGFLLKHNQFFGRIRQQVKILGYSFSNVYNNNFTVLPFTQLEELFLSYKILMLDNVTVLKKINLKALNIIEWPEIEIGFRRNYIFHESCHAVGRSIVSDFMVSSFDQQQSKLFNLLLEESFANASELFGMCQANTAIHKIFYESNSYASNFHDQSKLIQIQNKLGAEKLFKFAVLAYLHSNFLNSAYTKSEFKSVAEYIFGIGLVSSDLQQLQFVAQVAFSLDDNFKQLTRKLHFKLNDLSEAEFFKLKESYLGPAMKSGALANSLDRLAKVFYT